MDEYKTDYLEAAAEEAERFREAAMILAERAGISAEEAIYRIQEAPRTAAMDFPTEGFSEITSLYMLCMVSRLLFLFFVHPENIEIYINGHENPLCALQHLRAVLAGGLIR